MAQLLTFLKADAVLRNNVGAIIVEELMANEDLNILSFETRRVEKSLSAEHYAHVADRPFYPWLEHYVTACPVHVMLIEVQNHAAVERLRAFLGKTISHEAEAGTIRGRFGIYAGVNCVHLSDSLESGARETALWKKRLGIEAGRFDVALDDFIQRFDASLPNHNESLRKMCIQISDTGTLHDQQRAEIKQLLEEECPHATPEQVEALTKIVAGSALN